MFFKKKKTNSSLNLKNSFPLHAKDKRLLHYKKRRELNRQKFILNKTKVFSKFLLIGGLFYLLYLLITSSLWILPADIFSNGGKYLVVKGANITKPERIIQELKAMDIPQKPLYLINVKPYEEKIQKLPSIRKAFIRRYWLPARLEVLVEERTPMLTIAPSPKSPRSAAITSDRAIIPKEYLTIDKTKFPTYKI
ncbi:MAG: FtsQ-type POTRA domain-containing protein, partial [Candidatus Gastranaerophilales bacterium]|nr:FtsQ-type POTRA domain-containing protein [Candidatus Gastranaerophilales bacterium]